MKTKSFFAFLLVVAFLSVTVKSCKDDEVAVSSVSLDQKTYALAEGGQFVLTPTILPADAANKNVTWESSNAGVASVSGGVVNGVSAGTATITVKTVDGGKTDNCVVTVTKDVTGVTIAPSPASVPVGEEITLTASIEPAGASDQTVTWSKGDGDGDVTIAPSGLTCKVTGVTAGNIEVVVTTGNGKTAKCIVTVTLGTVSVASVELDKTAQTLPKDETFTLTATITPADATNQTVTWSQSGDGEVELEPDGLSCKVTGVAVGTVTITVTTEDGGETATCEVDVIAVGADFSESAVKVYNFSGATKWEGQDSYIGYTTNNGARYAAMDLEHVVISGRGAYNAPRHIFKLDDLKAGNTSNPTLFGTEGVLGGNGNEVLVAISLAHGHAYGCNLHTSAQTYPVRFYHWPVWNEDPVGDGTDNAIYQFQVTETPEGNDQGADPRFADWLSAELDESGNGFIFAAGRRMACVARIPVTNFSTFGEVSFILPGYQAGATELGERNPGGGHSFYRVDGAANEYLFSAVYEPVRLVTNTGEKLYTMTSFDRLSDGCAARVINFNGARYLVTMNQVPYSGMDTPVIAVYDITDGASTSTYQALQNFDNRSAEDKAPVYQYELGGTMTGDNGSNDGLFVSIDFAKDEDAGKLYIIGSATNVGFAIIEFHAQE